MDDTNQALLDLAQFKRRTDAGTLSPSQEATAKPRPRSCSSTSRDAFPIVSNEKNYNNQIGVAKTMLAIEGSPDYCIFELGTNHRGEMGMLGQW